MKYFIIGLLFSLFSPHAGHAFLQYTPDEETEKFRETAKSSAVFHESRDEIWEKFESKFSGFQLICDHLKCRDCEINKMLRVCGSGETQFLRFCSLKNREAHGGCWYNDLFNNCQKYAYLTVIYEQCPNKDEAIAILNYCMGEPSSQVFNFIELVETADLEKATIVRYFENFPTETHVGIYRGKGKIDSKWGSLGAIFRHKIFQVPKSYGDEVRFYDIVFKKLPPNFVKDNWPNRDWKLLEHKEL